VQCVIRDQEDFVFATHEDHQDVAELYPGAAIVIVPHDFRFAVDEFRRFKDPRRFAGEDGKALGMT
jgi:hypothetical protein